MFATPSCKPIDTKPDLSFPRRYRLLRSGDYRRVYRDGIRISGPYFRAFCRSRSEPEGPRIGLTTPRALGKAVMRNRIRRRLREAVRHEIERLDRRWDVVFNPNRAAAAAPFDELRREVRRVFRQCSAS